MNSFDEHFLSKHFPIQYRLVTSEFQNDSTFQGVWIIAKYILERNQIDRTLQFQTAEWLLDQNEEELALKVNLQKDEICR